MRYHPPQRAWQLFLQLVGQWCLLALFWYLGDLLHRYLHLPISSGILGLFLLLAALGLGWVKFEQVSVGAYAILRELIVFFLPIVVAVVQYKSLFLQEGWQILLCIGIGTMLVMISTGFTIHYAYRTKKYWHVRKRLQRQKLHNNTVLKPLKNR